MIARLFAVSTLFTAGCGLSPDAITADYSFTSTLDPVQRELQGDWHTFGVSASWYIE